MKTVTIEAIDTFQITWEDLENHCDKNIPTHNQLKWLTLAQFAFMACNGEGLYKLLCVENYIFS